jgi:hypothetical protein
MKTAKPLKKTAGRKEEVSSEREGARASLVGVGGKKIYSRMMMQKMRA